MPSNRKRLLGRLSRETVIIAVIVVVISGGIKFFNVATKGQLLPDVSLPPSHNAETLGTPEKLADEYYSLFSQERESLAPLPQGQNDGVLKTMTDIAGVKTTISTPQPGMEQSYFVDREEVFTPADRGTSIVTKVFSPRFNIPGRTCGIGPIKIGSPKILIGEVKTAGGGRCTLELSAKPIDIDPYEYFRQVVAIARSRNVSLVLFGPNQTIRFNQLPGSGPYCLGTTEHTCHIGIQNAQDTVFNFRGTTLIFQDTISGIRIFNSQRIVIANVTLRWEGTLATRGTVNHADDGQGGLSYEVSIDQGYDDLTINPEGLSSAVAIGSWDAAQQRWALEGEERGDPNGLPLSVVNGKIRTYAWSELENFTDDSSVLLRLKNHDMVAVRVDGTSSEDITIDRIFIENAHGLAFGISRVKRGLYISNCIIRRSDQNQLLSSAAGGINANVNGDFIAENNRFGFQGDDAFNLHGFFAIVDSSSRIPTVDPDPNFGISTPSFNVRIRGNEYGAGLSFEKDEMLGIFDANLNYQGMARILSLTDLQTDAAGKYVDVVITGMVGNIQPGWNVSSPRTSPKRFVIQNNLFTANRGRAMLLMASHGLVENNFSSGNTWDAYLLGPDYGRYLSGPGANNVIIRKNSITGTAFFGSTQRQNSAQFAALNITGHGPNARFFDYPLNQQILVTENTIDFTGGPGVLVSNGRNIVIDNLVLKNTARRNGEAEGVGSRSGTTSAGDILITRSNSVIMNNIQGQQGHRSTVLAIDNASTAALKIPLKKDDVLLVRDVVAGSIAVTGILGDKNSATLSAIAREAECLNKSGNRWNDKVTIQGDPHTEFTAQFMLPIARTSEGQKCSLKITIDDSDLPIVIRSVTSMN